MPSLVPGKGRAMRGRERRAGEIRAVHHQVELAAALADDVGAVGEEAFEHHVGETRIAGQRQLLVGLDEAGRRGEVLEHDVGECRLQRGKEARFHRVDGDAACTNTATIHSTGCTSRILAVDRAPHALDFGRVLELEQRDEEDGPAVGPAGWTPMGRSLTEKWKLQA